MSRNRTTIIEAVADREIPKSGQGNGKNGHKHGSQLLSWYLAQLRIKGLSHVLTANGYVILPTGFPGSRKWT
jgi:hypothetical protein